MNLRERVEYGAGRFAELDRAADLQRAAEHALGTGQVARPDADLAEGGERHGQAVDRTRLLVQRHRAVCERERLVVTVADQRDVGLVAAHQCEDVVGTRHRGKVLRLSQRGDRFVRTSRLRRHDREQRVAVGQVTTVAGRVQRGDRLPDLLPHDRRVADLAIAHAEFVVGEADGAGVYGELGLLEGAAKQRDRARLVAAQRGQAAVQPPQRGEPGGRDALAEHVRGTPEHSGSLVHVVAQQPRLGHGAARRQFVVAADPGRGERLRESVERVGASSALERSSGAGHRGVEWLGGHGESIAARDGSG